MEAPPGFEPGMEVLQTSALPLGDGAGWNYVRGCRESGRVNDCGDNSVPDDRWESSSEKKLERETGFEPATSTLARSHSTTELFPLADETLA